MGRSAIVLLSFAAAVAQPPAALRGPLVTSDRWPRATTLAEWTGDVMRLEGLQDASETAQGKAFFEWLRLFSRMAVGGMIQAYEGERGSERYVTDAHKTLFVYGWGYCDTTSRIAEAAWREFKQDPAAAERVCVQHAGGGYHTMYRLRLDGKYGAFDPRYGYYLLERDSATAGILDWPEVGQDTNLRRNRDFKYRSRPFFEIAGLEWERALLVEPAYFPSETAWRAAGAPEENVFGDSQYRIGTRFHSMDFVLPHGATIQRFWSNRERKFYVPTGPHTQREYPFLASGRFYRVTATSHDGNWPAHDPNYAKARPYLTRIPENEGYPAELAGGLSIGQASGRIIYQPDLTSPLDSLAPGATLVHASSPPYLRPESIDGGGHAVLDLESPYVWVDGTLDAALMGGGVRLEFRTLLAKPLSASEADVWSNWQPVKGRQLDIGGTYRFQLRLTVDPRPGRRTPAGLSSLRVEASFENGIMSIPQIFDGANTIHFRLNGGVRPVSPVTVEYRYQTAAGEQSHCRTILPGEISAGGMSYVLNAPGLIRCNSLSITY